jgi:hypothetical protein
MRMPPLLEDRPRSVQFVLAVVLPIAFGALAGVMLGVSTAVYIVVSLLAAVGGFAAGLEHVGAVPAAKRGLLGGALYGGALLIAHGIAGTEALVELSHPQIILVVFTAAVGAFLSAIGGSLRARRELGDDAREPPDE